MAPLTTAGPLAAGSLRPLSVSVGDAFVMRARDLERYLDEPVELRA